MKALIIKIREAGVFKAPRLSGSQDKVLSMGAYVSRFDKRTKTCTPYLSIPAGRLSYQHVANLLRVLWGQRPVPTLREVRTDVLKGDPYFEALAKKVRVKIETPVLPVDKGHKESYYPEETATIRKSIGDSWQTATQSYLLDGAYKQVKGGLLYPDRLRRSLNGDLYDQFCSIVKEYGGAGTVQKSIELLNVHKEDARVIAFCEACRDNGGTSLSNIIMNQVEKGISTHASPAKPLNLLMASGTIQTIEKFNAIMYVPVTDEDLEKIKEGTGVATYLEGGLATVEGVEDWSEILEAHELTVEGVLCT
jgi:hypothetical protein